MFICTASIACLSHSFGCRNSFLNPSFLFKLFAFAHSSFRYNLISLSFRYSEYLLVLYSNNITDNKFSAVVSGRKVVHSCRYFVYSLIHFVRFASLFFLVPSRSITHSSIIRYQLTTNIVQSSFHSSTCPR